MEIRFQIWLADYFFRTEYNYITLYFFLLTELFDIYYYYYYYYYYYLLRIFLTRFLSGVIASVKSQVSMTVFSIVADFNKAIVWMVSTCPLLSNSSRNLYQSFNDCNERTNYN